MAESELLGLLKIYTFLTNVKQPMQMQINVEISVAFFCTTLLARRLVPLSAQGRNTNVRRQVFWLSGSLPRIWSRICTQSPKIQQEIDSGKLINFSLLNTTSRIFSIKGGGTGFWVSHPMLLSFLQQKKFPFRAGVLANSAKKNRYFWSKTLFLALYGTKDVGDFPFPFPGVTP